LIYKKKQSYLHTDSSVFAQEITSSETVINATVETIIEGLQSGEKVQLVGFGMFDVKERAARMGRNPKTKEEIQIPASRAPVFKAGKAFKDAIG